MIVWEEFAMSLKAIRAWIIAQGYAAVSGHDADCNCEPCFWSWWLKRSYEHSA